MGDPFWMAAEMINNAAIVACSQLYLHRRLGTKRPAALRLTLGGLAIMVYLVACQLTGVPDSIRIPLLAIFCMLYGVYVAQGSKDQRIFHAFIAFSLAALSDVVAIALLTFLPGVTFGTIFEQTSYRLIAMVASKVILIPLTILHSRCRETASGGLYLAYVAFVPLMSVAMLTVLIGYETRLNGHGSVGLIALSLGLSVMNIVLLELYGRLAARAGELREKQRMLEQSEIQNRYFQETLAANDNLRGFRHDLKNHLQVLCGFLSMGNLERARGYLNEIGQFVNCNDFAINSGVPLVDAVLGSKLAMAKKQGIDVQYAVRLDSAVPIDGLDLCSILGNTLDNALEACQRLGGDCAKRITLTLSSLNGGISLEVRNPLPEGGCKELKSGKPGEGHGIGLSIVGKAVQKYAGSMKLGQDGGEFSVCIMIPPPGPAIGPANPGFQAEL